MTYVYALLIFIIAPLGTIMHELGHAIGARLLRADQIHLTVGSGKPIVTLSIRSFHMTINIVYFLGGMANSKRERDYSAGEAAFIAVCGPLFNGIFALFWVMLFYVMPSTFIWLMVLFNLWLFLVNLVPFQIKGKTSDGYTILKNILRK